MNPAFECLVEDCKVVIPFLTEGSHRICCRSQTFLMNVQKCSGTFFLQSRETTNGFKKMSTREDVYSHLSSSSIPELQFKLYTSTGVTDRNMSEEPLVVVNTAVYVKQFMEMNPDGEEPVRVRAIARPIS
jgi:hypothetical protein